MMKVLIFDGLSETAAQVLSGYPEIEVFRHPTPPAEQLPELIAGAHGVLVRSATKITRPVLEAAGELQVIGRAGVGVDNIDLEAATEAGVVVMNVPGANAISVAELTLGLMLSLARRIPEAHDSLKRGEWRRNDFRGGELAGKTLGLIGIGRIGRAVAERAAAFGMTILGNDPYVTAEELSDSPVRWAEFDEVVATSDYLSMHLPFNDRTRGLIGREVISRTKAGVRILNCARGGILDEAALAEAIASGHVAGAALDVFESEPPGEHPLLALDNVIAVPHIGAMTAEAQVRVASQAARQVGDALTGRGVVNAVNAGPALHEG